ncbi:MULTISPECIES: FMN-dependent NADH-azoreductase [unclassified Halomonas]|uniref:FMN-dependent NADH-azoreductase n=1 Tax=unclassified Halomonas TaxID=2609666 RepID=UPI0009903ECC|nr:MULTISPECIES: NAD(P)H-dependent oxidoreductase [unclassified Halomonas]AQU83094.1 FMN-dependent NADH-azoreductase [Halomonas sp. 'Soap Lake \
MTTRALLVTSSILGENGQSNALANHFKAQTESRSSVAVTHRDVVANALPHLAIEELGAWQTPVEERSAAQKALAAYSDELLAELRGHDVLVLAVPMYNLGIPSQLKAWFDRVLRAGETFRYTENGPQGLIEGKRAIILAARGGLYAGSEFDSQMPHLKSMLGLMGISDVEVVFAEGLNMGDSQRDSAINEAFQAIDQLIEAL